METYRIKQKIEALESRAARGEGQPSVLAVELADLRRRLESAEKRRYVTLTIVVEVPPDFMPGVSDEDIGSDFQDVIDWDAGDPHHRVCFAGTEFGVTNHAKYLGAAPEDWPESPAWSPAEPATHR